MKIRKVKGGWKNFVCLGLKARFGRSWGDQIDEAEVKKRAESKEKLFMKEGGSIPLVLLTS